MAGKKFELKTFTREKWRAQLEMLDKEYPLVLHTDAGRTFSMVRRMKAEKRMGIPINLRSGFAISTKNGKAANAMTVGTITCKTTNKADLDPADTLPETSTREPISRLNDLWQLGRQQRIIDSLGTPTNPFSWRHLVNEAVVIGAYIVQVSGTPSLNRLRRNAERNSAFP